MYRNVTKRKVAQKPIRVRWDTILKESSFITIMVKIILGQMRITSKVPESSGLNKEIDRTTNMVHVNLVTSFLLHKIFNLIVFQHLKISIIVSSPVHKAIGSHLQANKMLGSVIIVNAMAI